MEVFSAFFGLHTMLFAAFCWIFSFFVRRIVENTWPSLKKAADANAPGLTYLTPGARWWNEVILYFVPVFCGIAASLIAGESGFPFPDLIKAWQGRVLFGSFIGFICAYLWKLLRKILGSLASKITGEKIEIMSVPPPAG